jgi:hypothetical protein
MYHLLLYLPNASAIKDIRHKEKGKDAMCGGAREEDVEVTMDG